MHCGGTEEDCQEQPFTGGESCEAGFFEKLNTAVRSDIS